MKKKNLFLIAGIAAALVLTVVLVIVFAGGNTPIVPEEDPLSNTWKVIKEVKGEIVKYPTNGFFVFTEDKATEYRDGEASAFVVSDYTYTEKEGARPVLEMPVFSQVYEIEVFTANYIRLYENETDYKELIRYGNADRSALQITEDAIAGRWNVVYRGAPMESAKEWIVFSSTLMMHNLDGGDGSIADTIVWDKDGCIRVDSMSLKLKCYPAGKLLILVDTETDAVWELHKAPPADTGN